LRTTGPREPTRFLVDWSGNDGTFSGPPEIILPLNTPVDLKLSISPATSGVHSALLSLSTADGALISRVMNTIVAADRLDRTNGFTISRKGEAGWLHSQSFFIFVPAGAPALRVDVQIATGNVMPYLMRPNSRFYYPLAPDQSPVHFTRYQNGGSWSRTISHPDGGVWQVSIDNCN